MTRKGWIISLSAVAAVAALLVIFSGPRDTRSSSGKVRVVVTIAPAAYFVERVGGEHVEVQVLVGPGQSPHTFEPTLVQLGWLARAQVYFETGIPFEKQLVAKAAKTNASLRVKDISDGVRRRYMAADEAAGDTDEPAGTHASEAGEPDPHTWLNPLNAKAEAANVCTVLKEVDPAHAKDYEENLGALHRDLDAVNAKVAAALAPLKGRPFFVYHPAFGYFADAYGLRQVAVEIEGKSPSLKQVAELIRRARAEGVKVIFVQPQFSPKSAEMIAQEIGGVVVPINDLAHDYIRNLEEIAEKIRQGLSKP